MITRHRPASRKAIERALRHLADDRRAVEAWALGLVTNTPEGDDPRTVALTGAGSHTGVPTPGSFGGLDNREEVIAKPSTSVPRRAVEAWAASPSRKRTLRSLEREAQERMPGVDIDAVHKRKRR